MMYYLESESTDPHFNLAFEQYVFDALDREHAYFMLWRNHNAVIVGKHQNTVAEIDAKYVKEHDISVVRRLSGGGAVYHDLGNVNFTFIVSAGDGPAFDFGSFCRPVIRALASLGVVADINGRNDMTIDGKKFSGNAQYCKQGRIMHHGTILYDSDLSALDKALVVSRDKVASKGLKSVRSRVTNVKSRMADNIPVEQFMAALRDAMFRAYSLTPYILSSGDLEAIGRLQREVYSTWNWNYGASPAYGIRKERRVEGCGTLEVHMDVTKGRIERIAFFGDYFGNADTAGLEKILTGRKAERSSLAGALAAVSVDDYFHNLDQETFLDILTE
jgi:lipoate-protein ligase A